MSPAVQMTEAEWQEQFIQLAHFLGWKHMHARRSRGRGRAWTTATNVTGWPDLYLWSERQQRDMFVELKSADGKVTDEQAAVHASLRAAGKTVHVLRPDQLDEARAVLSEEGT